MSPLAFDLPPQVMIGLGVLVFVVLSHLRVRRVRPRRLVVLPLVLLVLGLAMVIPALAAGERLHVADAVVVALDVLLSLTLGAVRGMTVAVFADGGQAWSRYTVVTVGLWALSIALRFALGLAGQRFGAAPLTTSAPVVFFLGVTVLVQNLVVRARANPLVDCGPSMATSYSHGYTQ